KDKDGHERMFASYMKVRGVLQVYERGLCEWDDAKNQFEKVCAFPDGAAAYPGGQPFLHLVDSTQYIYFSQPYPLLRVRADPEALRDLTQYESFTCLQDGSRLDGAKFDRDADGALQYRWRKNTPSVGPAEQAKFLRAGKIKPAEALLQLCD